MSALSNAVALIRDTDFRDWIMAASVYQARIVITEATTVASHDIRLALAMDVVTNTHQHLERFINIIACDPDVAAKGTTVDLVTQDLMLSKMAGVWTALAKTLYTTPTVVPAP